MLHRSFKPAKCKTALKLSVSRIKLLKNKKAAQISQLKRELAQLLQSGQDRTARIRVEHVVREEKMVGAYDLVEIYCELLAARLPIIESQKNCPVDLKEAVSSVIFASPRCSDIPELLDIRKHFTAKYGKEFVSSAIELRPDCGVSRMLVEKLSAVAPDGQSKMKILAAIAQEHNIEWDPTSFEESNAKPPNDLLNGPNTLSQASQMHVEAPRSQAMPRHDQKHDVAGNVYAHDAASLTHPQNVVPSDVEPNMKMPPSLPSGMGSRETEFRHVSSVDNTSFLNNRRNWNMEFVDATAAAQAAAEAAERASMAARAAAELSSRESIGRQSSGNLKNSSSYASSDSRTGQYTGSHFPRGGIREDSLNNSFDDRSPRVQNEKMYRNGQDVIPDMAHRYYRDDNSTKEYSGEASLRSADSEKEEFVRGHQSSDRSTRRDYFEAESVKPDKSNFSQDANRKEPFIRFEDQYSRKSQSEEITKTPSSEDIVGVTNREQYTPASSYYEDSAVDSNMINQGFRDDIDKNFSLGPSQEEFLASRHESNTYENAGVVFDDFASDEDDHKFNLQADHNLRESHRFFPSPDRKSPENYPVYADDWNLQRNKIEMVGGSNSRSSFLPESHSASRFSESLKNSAVASETEDLPPLTFDDSGDSSSDSGKELSKSRPIERLDEIVGQPKQSRRADDSELTERDHERSVSSFKEVRPSELKGSLIHGRNDQLDPNDMHNEPLYVPADEQEHLQSLHSTQLTYEQEDREVFDPADSVDAGDGLNLSTLVGGLRNKGYKRPPYVRNTSNNASSLSNSTEKFDASTSKKIFTDSGSRYQAPNSRKARSDARKSSSRTVKYFGSSGDDSEEELLPESSAHNQQLDISKMSSSKAPVTYFDSDSGSENELYRQTSNNKGRSGSGISRRTKSSPHSRSSHSKVSIRPEVSEASDYGSIRKSSARSSMGTESPSKHQSRVDGLDRFDLLPESKEVKQREKEQPSGSLPQVAASGSSDTPKHPRVQTASAVSPETPTASQGEKPSRGNRASAINSKARERMASGSSSTATTYPFLFLPLLLFAISSSASFIHKFPTQAIRPDDDHLSVSSSATENELYETNYFTQTLDHFNFHPQSYKTFQQRYLTSSKHWGGAKERAPLFVYMGNEGDIEWFAKNTGFMFEIAPRFRALLVFLEHRYYGKSIPFGGNVKVAYNNSRTLGYLSSTQALADYATLIIDLKNNLTATDSPVVVFGGSYGGMLAAWFRLKYPHVSIGGLASSAPILYFDAITPPNTFYDTISQDFKSESETCYEVIRGSWEVIQNTANQPGGLDALEKTFHLCRGNNTADSVINWLQAALIYVAMTDYPTPSNFIRALPAYPIKQMCKAVDSITTKKNETFAKLYGAANIFYNSSGNATCFATLADTNNDLGQNGWNWQACTEMVMPMGASEQGMFPAYEWDYSDFVKSCHILTGTKRPRPHWITTEYGGHDMKRVLKHYGSNIIFFNGLRDPWSGGGVLKNISDTIVAIVAKLGAHHVDLRYSTAEDPQWLREVRKTEIKMIEGWISEYNENFL